MLARSSPAKRLRGQGGASQPFFLFYSIAYVNVYVGEVCNVYGTIWPYVTRAFRQSADSSGLCPIQLAWSRHRFVVLCRGAYAHRVC